MIRPFATIALLSILAADPAIAQRTTISDQPLSDRIVSYTINAELDPVAKTIAGRQQLTWRNPDKQPVNELQFHLYLNAFKDSSSTFMVESGGRHRGFSSSDPNRWGGISVDRMVRVGSTMGDRAATTAQGQTTDLTDSIRFIQPDDNNLNDRTVISVPLDEPVAPGETITLAIDFTSTLPRVMARTGWEYADNGELFIMAAQWFPKIGVLEVPGQRYVPADADRGVWNTHQFHENSEFYANFGEYDVTITTPNEFKVGASGVLVSETIEDDVTIRNFRADDVHDFAWTASPAFEVYTDTWNHVNLRLLIRKEHKGQRKRHLDAAKVALEYFDKWVGEYPYTTLTLVDGVGGSNGMEYPTLITMGTVYGLPSWVRMLEVVTIHEFGHQYFYGMLASNEFEEAWLDEGMNSYLETAIMDAAYGVGSVISFPGVPISDSQMQRVSYTESNPFGGALFTNSWEYGNGEFGRNSYSKPATVMRTLENVIGKETMAAFLKEYFETWKFRHPTTADLQATVERVADQDLDWFFDQFVYGTAVVDFDVRSMHSEMTSEQSWTTNVTIGRKYDAIIPVDVRVRFEDNSEQLVSWDARADSTTLTFESSAPIVEAFIDPENKIVLEITPLDNRVRAEPSAVYPSKVLLKTTAWFQGLFYLLRALI